MRKRTLTATMHIIADIVGVISIIAMLSGVLLIGHGFGG